MVEENRVIFTDACKNTYLNWFHRNCHFQTTWMGIPTQKTPFDAWIFQEIIFETKPTVIIEIGNFSGGSAIFMAGILDLIGSGKILGVDVNHEMLNNVHHERIEWILGDAVEQTIFEKVKEKIEPQDKVMIIEDSSHQYDNSLKILELYAELVSKGCYFIVEDGICKEDYISDGPKPGPYEAIHEFLKTHKEFQIDHNREKFLLTYNPDGYLKKS